MSSEFGRLFKKHFFNFSLIYWMGFLLYAFLVVRPFRETPLSSDWASAAGQIFAIVGMGALDGFLCGGLIINSLVSLVLAAKLMREKRSQTV